MYVMGDMIAYELTAHLGILHLVHKATSPCLGATMTYISVCPALQKKNMKMKESLLFQLEI